MSSAAGAGRERGRGWGAGPAWGGAGASPAPAAAGVGAALPQVGAAAGSHACPGLPPGRGPGAGRRVQRVGVAVSTGHLHGAFLALSRSPQPSPSAGR